LIYTGIKLAFHQNENQKPEDNLLLRLAKRVFPVAEQGSQDRFVVVENGRRCITKLFLVLLVIESTDVLFAVDSVPAIFSVVNPHQSYFTFVVFTSNVFAILGLRALYFLLAGVMDRFHHLHYGLSAVLAFVGLKMAVEYFFDFTFFKDRPWAALLIIVAILGVAIVASLLTTRKPAKKPLPAEPRSADSGPAASRPADSGTTGAKESAGGK
jgi:tellurite resistance protein TerC